MGVMVIVAVAVFLLAIAPYWELFESYVLPHIDKPLFVSRSCWFDNETGRDADCGYFYVAENRDVEDSRSIRIPVVILRGGDGASERPPILFISGGPGETNYLDKTWFIAWGFVLQVSPWLESRDVIIFDQRGAGISEPSLDCVEIRYRHRDWRFIQDWLAQAIADCRNRLVSSGIDLTQYHTPAIVADIIELRQALGIETWDIKGTSYGSRIALELMRSDPASINSAVLSEI